MHRVVQNIYMLPLFTSAWLSLRSIRMNWPAPFRTFSILLVSIFFVELMAIMWKYYFFTWRHWPYSRANLWLYNSFLVPQYLLYMAVYYQVLRSRVLRRTILVLGLLYTLFGIIDILYIQGIHAVNSYTLAISSAIMIFLTVAYFEQLRKEKEIIQLTREPMVWISLGAFVFHAADLPFIIGLNFLNQHNVALALALLYIYISLNCIMYLLYTIALLCPRPRQIL